MLRFGQVDSALVLHAVALLVFAVDALEESLCEDFLGFEVVLEGWLVLVVVVGLNVGEHDEGVLSDGSVEGEH